MAFKRTIRTPECPIAYHIHDQTGTIPRLRRSSSAARPQKRDSDILSHSCPPDETVIRILVVEPVLSVFWLVDNNVIDPVCVTVWRGDRVSAGEESGDPFVWPPLPRRVAVTGA